MFAAWNQGKRSIALDLTDPADRQVLYRLVEGVDVVVENFRPGVATRLGCDDAAVRRVNPALVTLSSSGYGDDESMAPVPAFDPLLQALGGIMAAQGGDDEPVFLTVAIHDVVTPLISAFGLVAGLYHRERTGRPQRVRTSLAQVAMAVQAAEHTRYAGSPPRRGAASTTPAPARAGAACPGPTAGGASSRAGPAWPIARFGLVNEAIARQNDLCVTAEHPEFGTITQYGQLVGGAGPPPGPGSAPRRAPGRRAGRAGPPDAGSAGSSR